MQKQFISATLILVLLLFPLSVLAQKQSTAPADNKDVLNRMSKEVGLKDAQTSKVEAIFNTERKKVEAVFDEERKKLQLIQEQTRTSLQAVLTPEQMDKLDKKMREKNNKNNTQKK